MEPLQSHQNLRKPGNDYRGMQKWKQVGEANWKHRAMWQWLYQVPVPVPPHRLQLGPQAEAEGVGRQANCKKRHQRVCGLNFVSDFFVNCIYFHEIGIQAPLVFLHLYSHINEKVYGSEVSQPPSEFLSTIFVF